MTVILMLKQCKIVFDVWVWAHNLDVVVYYIAIATYLQTWICRSAANPLSDSSARFAIDVHFA